MKPFRVPIEHPGKMLRKDFLWTATASRARQLGWFQQFLSLFLLGKVEMTPAMAIDIARVTGTEPELWMRYWREYLEGQKR